MMGETGPMGLHSKGRKTDMKTAAKRERKTLRIVELALLLGAAAFLMTGVWALNTQRDLADKVVRLHVLANSDTEEDQALKLLVRDSTAPAASAPQPVPSTATAASRATTAPIFFLHVRFIWISSLFIRLLLRMLDKVYKYT